MARILVCADGFFRTFSPLALEPLIEGFIESLVQNGHEVMPYINQDFDRISRKSKIVRALNRRSLMQQVKEFKPDLIFTFNNRIQKDFLKVTDCPVYIITSDRPVYWPDTGLISKYKSRYSMFYFNKDLCAEVNDQLGLPYDRQHQIPFMTSIKADSNFSPKYDVSFIGNFFNPSSLIYSEVIKHLVYSRDVESYQRLNMIMSEVLKHKGLTPQITHMWGFIQNRIGTKMEAGQVARSFMAAHTAQIRQSYLMALKDQDLHIFTWHENLRIIENNLDLVSKTHLEAVYSIAHNQRIFNESKISLTLPHAQVGTGFSWRVCDILASNALLLSNPSEDLETMFDGLVPTFDSPQKLHDMCEYYLKHEDERLDIVKQCQVIIDKNHRYENVLKVMADVTGIELLRPETSGKVTNLRQVERRQQRYIRKHSVAA